MTVRYIRHLGSINPDHVQKVAVVHEKLNYGPVRRYKDGPKKGRPRASVSPLGNVSRPYIDWFEGGRKEKAKVLIWYQGDSWPVERMATTNGEADRIAAEIRADLAAPVGPERIVAAAVRRLEHHHGGVKYGEPAWVIHTIEAPARHHDVLHRMRGDSLVVEQGFLTSTGRFVGRKDAWLLALAAGQLSPDVAAKRGNVTPDLFSEDLW